jgi:hypothetical protein
MKKTILVLLLFIGISISAKSQTFTASPADSIESTNNVNDWLSDYIYIHNSSSGPLNLSFQTLVNTMDPLGWNVLLCTNVGCNPYVPASGSLGTIASGDSAYFDLSTGFVGISGTGEIKFRVYETGNPSNADTLTYRYHATLTAGISDNNFQENFHLSQNFPNPFSTSTTIKYNLDNPNGKLVITDVQGKNVGEYKLTDNSGEVIIAENLMPGVYFYSLYSNDTMISKKKMIVQ